MAQKALGRYGLELGRAFQFIDDVLDYGGASGRLGKNTGDDRRRTKLTLTNALDEDGNVRGPSLAAMRRRQEKARRAAMQSGVAARPLEDFDAYNDRLTAFVLRSGLIMKPVVTAAKTDLKRIIYAEGEDERVLRAVQVVVDEGLAQPILVGRPEVVASRVERLGLRIRPGDDLPLINPQDDPRFRTYWQTYHELMQRNGVSPEAAREIVRTRSTVIAALAVRLGSGRRPTSS